MNFVLKENENQENNLKIPENNSKINLEQVSREKLEKEKERNLKRIKRQKNITKKLEKLSEKELSFYQECLEDSKDPEDQLEKEKLIENVEKFSNLLEQGILEYYLEFRKFKLFQQDFLIFMSLNI